MTLRLENLVIRKQSSTPLFSPINITIDSGEVAVVMGPSGCGKSTLLNLIAGHLSDEFNFEGRVLLQDNDLSYQPAHLRHVGIMFQDDLLFPHLNIWQNLAFALPNSVKGIQRENRAIEALRKVSLEQLAYSYPEQISGGQRARVSLVRMLLAEPLVVLLDEPFSKLDKDLRIQFRQWVFEQLSKANIPTLLVTHDEGDVPIHSQLVQLDWNITNVR
ncbi:ATP-binding cassette domain-containing protein [Vibrio atypicus]|uniref:ATP-binding cassette domain-containing protein n=1 Tax=Vibrio atypicus TaxID=558271 RepID=UPI003735E927